MCISVSKIVKRGISIQEVIDVEITDFLVSDMYSTIQMAKASMLSSAVDEIEAAAVEVAQTGDPAAILELSPMAMALFASEK